MERADHPCAEEFTRVVAPVEIDLRESIVEAAGAGWPPWYGMVGWWTLTVWLSCLVSEDGVGLV